MAAKITMLALAAATLTAALAGPAQAQPFRSAHTDHFYEVCQRVVSRGVADDDPVMERQCGGFAGIPIIWTRDPDSSRVAFGEDGLVGGYGDRFGFAVAGTHIEWRGPEVNGEIEPFAAIVRFQLCRAVGGPCRPELVLFHLAGDRRSCLAASIDGTRPDADERARAIADETVRGFRCGVDRARVAE